MLKGRRKIISEFKSEDLKNVDNIVSMINTAMLTHIQNREEIHYLLDYKKGVQTILGKAKQVRPEINNKLVVNHAQMITRNINGYFLGNPIQYILNSGDNKDDVEMLNRFIQYEDKYSVDGEIGEYQSICGTAYRIIYTDGVNEDEVPFEDKCLNPLNTFVIYSNDISEKPLAGVSYYDLLSDDNSKIGSKFYVYTENMYFEFVTDGMSLTNNDLVDSSFYEIGGVPIIEYPNNMWRIGDWELCIGLMDSINALHSGRLDDIDQSVQSLLAFINADLDADKYNEMRECGIISLQNDGRTGVDIKEIGGNLNQVTISGFASELEQLLYAMLGIPDRNNRSGGGGDTGQAVELRDGWADLEIVARNKELTFKKSEKQALKIFVTIMNAKLGTTLRVIDVDIKFSRNKNNNLLVKTQGYMNLLSTKTLSPADCLTIVDLVSDVNEYITRGELFWGKYFANIPQEIETDEEVMVDDTTEKSTEDTMEVVENEDIKNDMDNRNK